MSCIENLARSMANTGTERAFITEPVNHGLQTVTCPYVLVLDCISARWAPPPLSFSSSSTGWRRHGARLRLISTMLSEPLARPCKCWSHWKQVSTSFWADRDLCVPGWWWDHWPDPLYQYRWNSKVQYTVPWNLSIKDLWIKDTSLIRTLSVVPAT